jgi:hypothetical protein
MRLDCISRNPPVATDVPYGNEFTALFSITPRRLARALMDVGIVTGFHWGAIIRGWKIAFWVLYRETRREEIDRLARKVEKPFENRFRNIVPAARRLPERRAPSPWTHPRGLLRPRRRTCPPCPTRRVRPSTACPPRRTSAWTRILSPRVCT